MNVVPQEPGHAPLQASRAAGKAIASKIHFCHVMLGTDYNRTERPWVGVGCALMIHRHIEEARSAQGFARRVDFFQVAAEGFFTLVEAEHRLKCRWCIRVAGRMLDKGVVHAMTNRPFESLVQNPAPAHAVEFLQFGFEIRDVRSGPLLHNRRIETAKLCHMKERPGALDHGASLESPQPALQDGTQAGERAFKGNFS